METAHLIDEQENLTGILCAAANDGNHSILTPGIVLINSGFLHHIGPNRLYTELSRKLASAGFSCLRFDLSNIGDSLSGDSSADVHEQTRIDLSAAFSFMQRTKGCEKFIVLGICSGADDAFDIASSDQRVTGVIMIDGHGFRTPRFYLNHIVSHFGRRIFSLNKWKRITNRLVRIISRNKEAVEPHSNELDDSIRIELSKKQVSETIDIIVARECKLHFIYTGGVSDYYNYHGQFSAMFPISKSSSHVSNCYLPQSDHLFMLSSHRDAVLHEVQTWISHNFS